MPCCQTLRFWGGGNFLVLSAVQRSRGRLLRGYRGQGGSIVSALCTLCLGRHPNLRRCSTGCGDKAFLKVEISWFGDSMWPKAGAIRPDDLRRTAILRYASWAALPNFAGPASDAHASQLKLPPPPKIIFWTATPAPVLRPLV
jgi:hypothetical protein